MAKRTSRDDELSNRPKIRKKLIEMFQDIEKGFADQNTRADDILDYWDMHNCTLGERQFYNGNSKIFVPLIKNAVKARKTRFVNQIFPQSGRYVEVTTENGDIPHATMALAEHYVRRTKLRTQVVPALMTAGDVEGQYSLYVGWQKTDRHVTTRESKPLEIGGLEYPEMGDIETMVNETLTDSAPTVEVIADADLLVMPVAVDSIPECMNIGGSVTVLRRWTKTKIRQMIDDGEFDEEAGESLLSNMAKKDFPGRPDTKKKLADDAGIRQGGSGKYCIGYETWTKLKVDGEMRVCRAYYGGDDQVLGCKLNPYWNDRVPVISTPVDKLPGVFKGKAPIADVMDLQILANDMVNEGADTAHFSAMPIIMTDPEKNPRVGTMVLGLAAVWETNPKDTQFAQFPPLWEKAFEVIGQAKQQIYETLGVNPSMMPQQTGGKQKRNQAEIANEQQVDLLTTADAVTNIEEGVLTPLVQWFIELDHQFRDDPVMIRSFGEMGLRAQMEEIPPIQMNNRYEFRWSGVEAARNAAQVQQQIAGVNVIKAIPPQLYAGHKLNLTPVLTQFVENLFGPRLAPLVFEDMKSQLATPPETENGLLLESFDMPVHEMDDDAKHLQVHQQALGGGDPSGMVRVHIQKHLTQIQMKQQASQQQGQDGGKGLQGAPGGAGPGAAGTPPGAQAGPMRPKGPPGMMHQDQLPAAGAVQMPRKM